MGREGQALVMLLDSEASYVDFLRLNQHILLHKFIPSLPPTPSVLSEAQELAARERYAVPVVLALSNSLSWT